MVKKLKFRKFRYLLLSLLCSQQIYAQVTTVQPSIMVIPFVQEGQDIRTTLDWSSDKRQIIAQVNGAFADKGYPTRDFYQVFKNISQNAVFEDDSQSDLKTQVIESSGADIYIEADVNVVRQNDGNSVRVVLKACDAATGKVLASKIGDSGKFYTDNIGKLGTKAVDKAMDGFLATLQQSFNDMMINGRSIVINLTFHENSDFDANTEVGNGDQLRDLLEEWMEDNAYRNYASPPRVVAKKMIWEDVRIPIRDSRGNNYSINTFARNLYKFLRSNNIDATRQVNGGTLYIQIN